MPSAQQRRKCWEKARRPGRIFEVNSIELGKYFALVIQNGIWNLRVRNTGYVPVNLAISAPACPRRSRFDQRECPRYCPGHSKVAWRITMHRVATRSASGNWG